MEMTIQEAFDKVWRHFITEHNPRSFFTNTLGRVTCMYRGPGGCRCAVGVLMPDDVYDVNMEESTVIALVTEPIPQAGHEFYTWMQENLEFLQDLQRAHDQLTGPDDAFPHLDSGRTDQFMPKAPLLAVAKKYNLTVPGDA